jgi:hypothetical protein
VIYYISVILQVQYLPSLSTEEIISFTVTRLHHLPRKIRKACPHE